MLREVLDGTCVGGIWCASARASGINFQACAFNHSAISPFRIKHLRTLDRTESDLCPGLCPNPVGVSIHFYRLRATAEVISSCPSIDLRPALGSGAGK